MRFQQFAQGALLLLAIKATTVPTPTPWMALKSQPSQGPHVMTRPIVKIVCPSTNVNMKITVNGAEAASWTPKYVNAFGLSPNSPESAKGTQGRDELRCLYWQTWDSPRTETRYYMYQYAPPTHPVCRGFGPSPRPAGEKYFECRRLKPGENYATAVYYQVGGP